jgi:hypothetical protein
MVAGFADGWMGMVELFFSERNRLSGWHLFQIVEVTLAVLSVRKASVNDER